MSQRTFLGFRAILVGLVFFICVVGCSVLYSWHIRRTTDRQQPEMLRRQHQPKRDTHSLQDTLNTNRVVVDLTETPLVPEDLQAVEADDATALSSEDTDPIDLSDAFLPDDFVLAEERAEDVRVSPFGFGQYPEVPAGYPNPNLWDYAEALYELSPERARNWELRERVSIKLWNQGKRIESVAMEDGLVYPCYPNTVYVRWGEFTDENGTRVAYIEEVLGSGNMLRYDDDFNNDIIPPGITVIPYDEGGIDPYTFLELN